jgi:hypothetical protein
MNYLSGLALKSVVVIYMSKEMKPQNLETSLHHERGDKGTIWLLERAQRYTTAIPAFGRLRQ